MVIFLHSGNEPTLIGNDDSTVRYKKNLLELSSYLLEFAIKERFFLSVKEDSLLNVMFRFDTLIGTKRYTFVRVLSTELIENADNMTEIVDAIRDEIMHELALAIKATLNSEKVLYESIKH